MTSLTSYLSIWVGIIVVGFLLAPNTWQKTIENLSEYLANPTTSFIDFLKYAFNREGLLLYIGGIMFFGMAGAIVTNFISGGGVSLLFLIPALLIFAVITLLLNPLSIYMTTVQDVPMQVRLIYVLFMGVLTFLTMISFTGGRS